MSTDDAALARCIVFPGSLTLSGGVAIVRVRINELERKWAPSSKNRHLLSSMRQKPASWVSALNVGLRRALCRGATVPNGRSGMGRPGLLPANLA